MRRVLVAGVGNIFMGDDAFGCEVARRFGEGGRRPGVDVVDFGIRGIDLEFALADGYDLAILIDAAPRGGCPGTLYVIEAGEPANRGREPTLPSLVSPHDLTATDVLSKVATLDARPPQVVLVGCEPGDLGGEEGSMGLSEAVAAAVDRACEEIEKLLAAFAASEGRECSSFGGKLREVAT